MARPSGAGLAVEVEGMAETRKALDTLHDELAKPSSSADLRAAAQRLASPLAADLRAAAGACGVPVAPRVASAIRASGGVVAIGGSKKVGRYGAPAALLVWGSEAGPKSDPNHFGVAPNSSGYWIAPTVARFRSGPAVDGYNRAVRALLHGVGF